MTILLTAIEEGKIDGFSISMIEREPFILKLKVWKTQVDTAYSETYCLNTKLWTDENILAGFLMDSLRMFEVGLKNV